MVSRAFILTIVVAIASPTYGDGLAYKLPADGAWARFRLEHRIRDLTTLDGKSLSATDVTLKGTFTLRSVGTQDTDKGPGRWIELESNGQPTDEYPGRIIVLKMLILERDLAIGADPLAHVEDAYFWNRDWPYNAKPEPGVKEQLREHARILYEIERFRPYFPFPRRPGDKQQTASDVKIQTPLGALTTTKIAYPMEFSGKLSGGTRGHWSCSGVYSLWLADESPFGVVALETEYSQAEQSETKSKAADQDESVGEGVRAQCTVRLELEASGMGANSALPEYPRPK